MFPFVVVEVVGYFGFASSGGRGPVRYSLFAR